MDWENKKVLVTGVSGFIGSNLTEELLKRGAKIYAIDNFSYIDSEMARNKLDFFNKIELIEGDVSTKYPWLNLPSDIEYIFHFAGPSSITSFKKAPERCYYETVFGLFHALEFAKKNNIKKIVYPSSGSNYAGNEMPHNESIYPKPRNLYAASKIACEGLSNSYSDFVKFVAIRIFGGYGPGEEWKKDFGSVIYLFIRDYMNGNPPEIWGDGRQTRDFIYVEDIVKAIITSAETDYVGVINAGTGESVSFKEILEIIKEVLGTEISPIFIPKEVNYVEDLEADTFRMRKILGIKPISPREGIKKFIEYLKNSN